MNLPQPVTPEHLRIGGELAHRAARNLERLEGDLYAPPGIFKTEEQSGWWPGDYEGRIVLGTTLLCRALRREPRHLREILRLYPAHLNARGYFGSIHEGIADEQQLSSHGWVMRGLSEYYEWTGDPAARSLLEGVLRGLVLPTAGWYREYPIDPAARGKEGAHSGGRAERVGRWCLSTDIGCFMIFADGAAHAYQHLPSPELRGILEEIWERFLQIDLCGIEAQTHATLTGLRALLRWWRAGGCRDGALLTAVRERYALYRQRAMTEHFANWNWFGRPRWTEPCAVVDAYQVATQLWQATGEAAYLADAQRMYYNALGHGQRANGGYGCDCCAGHGSPDLKLSVYEATWCCTMRGAEGLARAIESTWFTRGNTAWLTHPHPSQACLPLDAGVLEVRLETDYPRGGRVRLEVLAAPEAEVTLALFAPPWMEEGSLSLNGSTGPARLADGWVRHTGRLARGDVLEYRASPRFFLEPTHNPTSLPGRWLAFHGPRLLAAQQAGDLKLAPGALPEAAGQPDAYRIRVQGDTYAELRPIADMIERRVDDPEAYGRQLLFG